LAYLSDESGRFGIYVQHYSGPGGKLQISTEGGTEPAWIPTGRKLINRDGDKIMAVEIATQPDFSMGMPRMFFEGYYEKAIFPIANYNVSPDGQLNHLSLVRQVLINKEGPLAPFNTVSESHLAWNTGFSSWTRIICCGIIAGLENRTIQYWGQEAGEKA
jgi:hypothetical protein